MSRFAARFEEEPVGRSSRSQASEDATTVPIRTVTTVSGEGLFSGILEELSLTDFLQVLEMGMRSAEVTIWAGSGPGVLILEHGKLVHVEVGELRGEAAFFELCSWRAGDIHVRPLRSQPEPSIDSSLSFLLLEFARQMDSRGLDSISDSPQTNPNDSSSHPIGNQPPGSVVEGSSPEDEKALRILEVEMRISEQCAELVAGQTEVVGAAMITSGEPLIIGGAFSRDFSRDYLALVAKSITGVFHRIGSASRLQVPSSQPSTAEAPLPFHELELSSEELHFIFRVLDPRPIMACLAIGRGESLGMGRAILNSATPRLTALATELNLHQSIR